MRRSARLSGGRTRSQEPAIDPPTTRRAPGWRPGAANAHATIASLLADLDQVRARGYAVDDGETVEGIVCLGVTIPARQPGEGPYAASVTLLEARATGDRVPGLIADLVSLRERLSHRLRVVPADV